MLVDRRILNVKRTKLDEALALFAEFRKQIQWHHPARIYKGNVAAFDQLVVEVEFADWAEMEAFWSGEENMPAFAAFYVKWEELALPGGKRELWETV